MAHDPSPNGADSRLFGLFIGLLFWLPIPFGSNRPWAVALFACITFGLLLCWLALFVKQRVALPHTFVRSWFVISALGTTQIWVFISLYDIPLLTSGSLDPSRSLQKLLLGLSLTALFCLTLLLLTSRRRIKLVIFTLIISGICQALYGGMMVLSDIEAVATGTFINRNHLAGYLELCLAVGIGFMIASLNDNAASNWRDVGRRMLKTVLGPKSRVRIGLVIMVAALVMTHSRMGNTAFFASMTLAGIIALILSKRASKATIILLTSLILIDVAVVGTFFGVENVVNRIENTTLVSERRDDVDLYAWVLLQDNLLTGTGAGSFYGVFPEYREEYIGPSFFDQAHNDYLQFQIELGLIGFVPLLSAVLLTFLMALRAQWVRKEPLMRGLSFSVIMAIIAFGIHSTVDFNLQIPSNAATFMVILALGWISVYFKEKRRSKTKD